MSTEQQVTVAETNEIFFAQYSNRVLYSVSLQPCDAANSPTLLLGGKVTFVESGPITIVMLGDDVFAILSLFAGSRPCILADNITSYYLVNDQGYRVLFNLAAIRLQELCYADESNAELIQEVAYQLLTNYYSSDPKEDY